MRSPLTFTGALEVLGHYDRPLVDRISRALGGTIIAAGAGLGLATAGPAALAGLAVAAPLWGWVDQKNEALQLLTSALNRIRDQVAAKEKFERHQLIAVAHSILVISAFFEALREELGDDARRLRLSGSEQETLALGRARGLRESSLKAIYTTDIPAPSVARGFTENLTQVEVWLSDMAQRVSQFAAGLAGCQDIAGRLAAGPVVATALNRYRSGFLALGAAVPEFQLWTLLGEHSATRAEIRNSSMGLRAILSSHADALGRVESLLALTLLAPGTPVELCERVDRANRAVLEEPIITRDARVYGTAITFPTVEEIYLNPRCRIAERTSQSRPSEEDWWAAQPISETLDVALATHMTTLRATRTPLLLLGHPGAGKSMLTKVLAARLPASGYTTVRVQLSRVAANSPIHEQVQQALNVQTSKRVSWAQLTEESAATLRVVLLDGLDELLQATTHDRTGYLHEVAEFQRAEDTQGHPVVVIVTSRTVVADRVDIPTGTAMMKLEEFSEAQVEQWLARWQDVNAAALATGGMRGLSFTVMNSLGALSRQPLLLLMLAIYCADPESPPITGQLSQSSLYSRLLRSFAEREVTKRMTGASGTRPYERAVQEQLRRLSIAALGMFNRGRQDITEAELSADIAALREAGTEPDLAENPGLRVLGEFFFVHSAEARLDTEIPGSATGPRRCYEFLHATFAEFLVAEAAVEAMAEVADAAFGGRRSRPPEDGRFAAMFGWQPLAARRPILSFARELLEEKDEKEREDIADTLHHLISEYRRRPVTDRFVAYRPGPVDGLRQLAAYSANLVLLRLILEHNNGPVPLADLWQHEETPLPFWRSTIRLWQAGLDDDSWRATLSSMYLSNGNLHLATTAKSFMEFTDFEAAVLADEEVLARRLKIGIALQNGAMGMWSRTNWVDEMISWLIPLVVGAENAGFPQTPMPPPVEVPHAEVEAVHHRLASAVLLRNRTLDYFHLEALMRWMLLLRDSHDLWSPHAAAAAVAANPKLLIDHPALREPGLYSGASGAALLLRLAEEVAVQDQRTHLRTLRKTLIARQRSSEPAGNRSAGEDYEAAELLAMALHLTRAYGSRESRMPSGYADDE